MNNLHILSHEHTMQTHSLSKVLVRENPTKDSLDTILGFVADVYQYGYFEYAAYLLLDAMNRLLNSRLSGKLLSFLYPLSICLTDIRTGGMLSVIGLFNCFCVIIFVLSV